MFSWIKSIFTSDNLVDGVIKGVDKSFFTDEEKADNWNKVLKLYEPFKLAQRLISLALLFLLGLGFFTAVFIRVGGMILYTPSDAVAELIVQGKYTPEYIETSAWILANTYKMFFEPFLWAVGFYFGGGAAEGVVTRWKTGNKDYTKQVMSQGNMNSK